MSKPKEPAVSKPKTDLSRRTFFKYTLTASGLLLTPRRWGFTLDLVAQEKTAATELGKPSSPPALDGWFMPSEQAPHTRCWMAWPRRPELWAGQQMAPIEESRKDFALLSSTIARFEPVNMLVTPEQAEDAKRQCGPTVSLVPIDFDDAWFRDSGPVFLVKKGGGVAGSIFNFNAWGEKQTYAIDGKVAEELLTYLKMPQFRAPFVTEGGALEVDGEGTLVVGTPSIKNDNRNKGKSLGELTKDLCGWLGVTKVLWLPSPPKTDYWTDGHVDGTARFVEPGVMLVDSREKEAVRCLKEVTDAKGRKIKVLEVDPPSKERMVGMPYKNFPYFCDCYVNFYFANGAVIMPKFGDKKADESAQEIVAKAYPNREVVALELGAIASGGGLIHCVTQQEPKPIA